MSSVRDVNYSDTLNSEDVEEVADYIRNNYSADKVVIHGDKELHIGYWDKSDRFVQPLVLAQMQAAGFGVVQAGIDDGQAHVEFRKHDPRDVYGGDD